MALWAYWSCVSGQQLQTAISAVRFKMVDTCLFKWFILISVYVKIHIQQNGFVAETQLQITFAVKLLTYITFYLLFK